MKPSSATLLVAIAIVAGPSISSAALNFNPVVTTLGDGSTTLSSAAAATAIRVYQTGTAAQAAALASTSYNSSGSSPRLTNSGSATSEATLSNNPAVTTAAAAGAVYSGNAYAFSGGYDANVGTTGVVASAADRVVGAVTVTNSSAAGATVLQSQTGATAYNTNNLRSATGNDARTTLYTAGTATTTTLGGFRNFTTNTILASTPTNTRTTELLSGGLFGSTGSGTVGIYSIDPTGAGSASPATLFIGTSTNGSTATSPYEFALFNDSTNANAASGYNTAYVSDDSANGGILKFTYNGAAWNLAYTLKEAGTVYRGLAGEYDAAAGQYTLFATTSDGQRLVQVTDAGASSPFTTLATAGTGYAFRGVALTSVATPEPTTAVTLAAAAAILARRRRRA